VRTTVTLYPDTEALLRELMARDGIGFKQAVNEAIRRGLSPAPRAPFKQRSFAMGFRPDVPYDRALHLAGELENRELARKPARSGSGSGSEGDGP
jgi:hypothetical protein